MKVLVDTCGWIEWLTDGVLADKFAPYIIDISNIIVPTSIQYELQKWIYATAIQEKVQLITSDDHFQDLPSVQFFLKKPNIIALRANVFDIYKA